MKHQTEVNRKWRNNNPEKYRAHAIVRNEVEYGRIIPQPCEKCNKEKAHAHHEDYSKPLEIMWLCNSCHRKLHTEKSGRKAPPRISKANMIQKPRHKHYQPAPKRDIMLCQAQRLRTEGASYKTISKALGVSKGTIYKWLNDVTYN